MSAQRASCIKQKRLKNLQTKRAECDEIWSFIGSKEANVPPSRKGEFWPWRYLYLGRD